MKQIIVTTHPDGVATVSWPTEGERESAILHPGTPTYLLLAVVLHAIKGGAR